MSMSWEQELDQILRALGVQREGEHLPLERPPRDAYPDLSIFQSSARHYGTFYRLDLVGQLPQVSVLMPTDEGPCRLQIYLVRFSQACPFNWFFLIMARFAGSKAFGEIQDDSLSHLLGAMAEVLKMLFWKGDLERMRFPPEICVERVL